MCSSQYSFALVTVKHGKVAPEERVQKNTGKKVVHNVAIIHYGYDNTCNMCAFFYVGSLQENGTSPAIYLCVVCAAGLSLVCNFVVSSSQVRHKCIWRKTGLWSIRHVSFFYLNDIFASFLWDYISFEAGLMFDCLSVFNGEKILKL